jgi:hypothetical protein
LKGLKREKRGAGALWGTAKPGLWTGFLLLIAFFTLGWMIDSSPIQAVPANSKTTGLLTVHLDRSEVPVGSIVEMTLTYTLPEGASIPEKPEIRGLEGLTVVEQTMEAGRIRIRLLVDQLGSWKSNMITLGYVDKENEKGVLKADPVSITVLSNLGPKPAEARLRPIQDIVSTQSVWKSAVPWTVLIIAVAIVAACVFWWIKKRRRSTSFEAYTEPPHIRAKKEIEALNAQKVFENGHAKIFYFGLSEILRHYLEAIRHFPAAEFTTEEIGRHIELEQDQKLMPLLRQADMVKFSDIVPTQARKDEDTQAALLYVRETSPEEGNENFNKA